MATVFNATIKRVSDQPRNSSNQATPTELNYIRIMKDSLNRGVQPSPVIYELEGKVLGYYPILTNAMCLQCHGKPGIDIMPKTSSMLATLYPNDQATGYDINQLRGIWVVTMEKEK